MLFPNRRRSLLGSAVALTVAGAAAVPAHAGGAGLHVDRAGQCDDGRAPAVVTRLAPWCSLDRAVAAAPAGSVVLVHAGAYPELDLRGGSRSGALTLRAAPGEAVEIDGVELSGAAGIRVEGFRITDDVMVRDGSSGVAIVGNDVPGRRIWITRSSGTLVEGNWVHDLPAGMEGGSIGIRLMDNAGSVVRGNVVERLSNDPLQATKERGSVIEGNVLRHAHPTGDGEHTDGIQVLGADGLVIRANTVRDVEHGLMFTDFDAAGVTIESNVVSQVTGGIGFKAQGDGGMPGLRLTNNTFYDTLYGVNLRGTQPDAVVRNNIFDEVVSLDDQPVAEHNLVGGGKDGPRFVDAANGDFTLAPGSPGIDAGTSVGAPAADGAGRPRWDDPEVANTGAGPVGYVDVGALERSPHQPGAPAAPAAPEAGAGPRAKHLRVRRLSRRRGLLVTFKAPRGVRRAVVTVSRVRRGKHVRVARKAKRIHPGRVRVRFPKLRLKPARYVVRVRVGRGRELGARVSTRLRVRR